MTTTVNDDDDDGAGEQAPRLAWHVHWCWGTTHTLYILRELYTVESALIVRFVAYYDVGAEGVDGSVGRGGVGRSSHEPLMMARRVLIQSACGTKPAMTKGIWLML